MAEHFMQASYLAAAALFILSLRWLNHPSTGIAIKRSMNPGFAGIDNELYSADNTLMVFGDAKNVLGDIVKALSGEGAAH